MYLLFALKSKANFMRYQGLEYYKTVKIYIIHVKNVTHKQ